MRKNKRTYKAALFSALTLIVLTVSLLLCACDNAKIVADYYLDTVNAKNYTVEYRCSDSSGATIYRTEDMLYYLGEDADGTKNEFYLKKTEDAYKLGKKDEGGIWAEFAPGEGATLDFLPVISSNFSALLNYDSAHNTYAAKEELLSSASATAEKDFTAIVFTLADDYSYLTVTAHYKISSFLTMKESYKIYNVGTTEITIE